MNHDLNTRGAYPSDVAIMESMRGRKTIQLNVKTLDGDLSRSLIVPGVSARDESKETTGQMPSVPQWKRVLDVGIIILLSPFWGLVMLAIAAMIKLLSPGPVLFRQERVGLGERKFTCLKFRTMKPDAEISTHQELLSQMLTEEIPMKKMDGKDDRLIPFAWILRSTGFDELPQLFNVLHGEMSLVGPRPCTPYEFEQYQPWQRERFKTLPGLTGLWQVSGKNRTTFRKMIELDIHYSRTKCVWLDVGIMLRTFPALLGQVIENRIEHSLESRLVVAPRSARGQAGRVNGLVR